MHMNRRPLEKIIIEINNLLKKEKNKSVRYISNSVGCEWRTAKKALDILEKLEIIKQKWGIESQRKERLYHRIEG